MKYVPVILEEVGPKYCKPGEHIVHTYYVQTLRLREGLNAYRRNLYTEMSTLSFNEQDFYCDRFKTMEEALAWKNEYERHFPLEKWESLEIRPMTDEEIFQHSIGGLKRT